MRYIDFEAKTDRELLVLVAQKANETTDHLAKINSKLLKHEQRITDLESCSVECEGKRNWKTMLKVNWQTLSLLASLLALIILEIANKV